VLQLEFNALATTYEVKKLKGLFQFGKLLDGILNTRSEFN